MRSETWERLNRRIVSCGRCPRLRGHCLEVARVKRAAFRDQAYWGKPVPNLGPADPAKVRLLIVGLAPAAHGANRTGRMFTGDRSGEFLFRAMHETGWASQPTGTAVGDGLELIGCAITATCHCAPPDNKPLPDEVANCEPFLDATVGLLPGLRGVLGLGKIGFDAGARMLKRAGRPVSAAGGGAAKFAHGAVAWSGPDAGGGRVFLMGSYHPSQQNTFTGRLTREMMRKVFERARELAGG